MVNVTINLEDLTLDQLKVLAYDTATKLKIEGSNLEKINQMIEIKSKPTPATKQAEPGPATPNTDKNNVKKPKS